MLACRQPFSLWRLYGSTCREGVVKAEGVPDGEDLLPHSERSGLSKLHRAQQALGRIDVQHTDVLIAVSAHQRPVEGLVEAVNPCRAADTNETPLSHIKVGTHNFGMTGSGQMRLIGEVIMRLAQRLS